MLKFPLKTDPELIEEQVREIKVLSEALKHVPLAEKQEKRLFHGQILKSSLFSARIEGNQLSLATAENLDLGKVEEKEKRELSNIVKARRVVRQMEEVDEEEVKKLHQVLMEGVSGGAGACRREVTAIFNQHGQAVYVTPDVTTLQEMLDVFVKEINKPSKGIRELIIDTARCHYYFEKIHPFVDGNGRTGRVLLHWQLEQYGLAGNKPLPIEEYWEEKRSTYYRHLERDIRKIDDFVVFVADSLAWSLRKVLEDIKKLPEESSEALSLLPRRMEILEIVRGHPHCSMDFISRRFPALSKRMILYDVKNLIDKGLVKRHGQTRGVVYSAKG